MYTTYIYIEYFNKNRVYDNCKYMYIPVDYTKEKKNFFTQIFMCTHIPALKKKACQPGLLAQYTWLRGFVFFFLKKKPRLET